MSRQEKEQPTVEGLHVFSMGAFGKAVAYYLKTLRAEVVERVITTAGTTFFDLSPQTSTSIIAAGQPIPELCKLLEDRSFEYGRAFIPLVLDSANLIIGPVVIPGAGACWSCWNRRSIQHASHPDERLALLQHYSNGMNTGPVGYLESYALLGAARIAQILNSFDSPSGIAGYVWQIHVITREIVTSKVTGIHDCPRCGLGRRAPTRTFAELQHELAYLWESVKLNETKL